MWPGCFPSPPSCCGHPKTSSALQPGGLGSLSALCTTVRAYQRKVVRDLAIRWDFGTKAIGREELVTVVVLDDFPHGLQCQGIGAQLVGADVVQRGGL